MERRWIPGNDFQLLENGEEFFPRVFACIANARREVIVETFILFEDKVGLQLHEALLAAARRGAQVDNTIDDWGSPDLSEHFLGELRAAGVRIHSFNPWPRPFGLRPHLLRRMHRKIVVVDREVAFVGGINYSADHLRDFGAEAKQDYSVEIRGPLVAEIHRFCHAALAEGLRHQREKRQWWRWRKHMRVNPEDLPAAGSAEAMFVVRDNRRHMDDIERQYRIAIRSARKRIVIANAYFFPGYRFIKELKRAARRGVDVRLILQGEPDMPFVKTAASMLYHNLLRAGVRIYEYCERPLHGKVAVMDDSWATVGSSNLDPMSLSFNLEANVIIRDRAFTEVLSANLDKLMCHACTQVTEQTVGAPEGWALVRSFLAYHFTRYYPRWAQWLPRHVPRLLPTAASAAKPVAPLIAAKEKA
jgi:cardiolipin synthase